MRIKTSMGSLDIRAWLAENAERFTGAHLQKFYEVGDGKFLFKFHKSGEGTLHLYADLRGALYEGEADTPMTPTSFARYVRKRFTNAVLEGMEQLNFDRVLRLNFRRGSIVLEMFRDGNLLVLDEEGVITYPYRPREYRDRALLPSRPYTPPPARPDITAMDVDALGEALRRDREVVRTLASLNLGGEYAEELCARAGVDRKKKGTDLTVDDVKALHSALRGMLRVEGGFIYLNDERPFFLSPIPMTTLEGDVRRCETFNEAAREYFEEVYSEKYEFLLKREEELSKLRHRLEEQREALERFRREEEEHRKKGEAIYAHYAEVEKFLEWARGAIRDEETYEKTLRSLPYVTWFEGKRVRLRLPEGVEVEVDVERSVGENADAYFTRAKRMKEKARGVEAAIKETERAMEEVESRTYVEEERRDRVRRKRFWFERFRWFISSEGILVIAGRDARTNEAVVRKHLGTGDLYVHADIHGAPSVVIKGEGREIGEATIREACQFALAMSKAWNAGWGSGAAYWVYPSQVTKMAESGEFVPRGAWVVRGKRNYVFHLEVLLAVGEVEYRGVKMVMCGPPSAVEAHSHRYVVIAPGDVKKSDFAKYLRGIFNEDVDTLQRILPPGGIRIIKKVGMEEGQSR